MAASDWCHDHVKSALIGYVCVGLYKPVGGNCFCVKELSLVYVELLLCVQSFAPVIYIYTFILW